MISYNKLIFVFFIALMVFVLNIEAAFARGGGGGGMSGSSSIGFGLSILTANQKDLNSITDYVNSSQGGLTTKALTSGYDFYAQYQYRFTGSIYSLVFRPSFFMESGSGSGNTVGDYKHELTGYTFFPMLRLYPLENAFIKFYLQFGVGYGYLKGEVTQGANKMSYSGSNFGGQTGLGAEFCFTASQCVALEGNVRYLPIERNVADSVTGSFTASNSGFTNAAVGREVEYDQNDMSTTLSGIQGAIAYIINF